MSIIDPGFPLTPSELVLLNGERFAENCLYDGVKVIHNDTSVSDQELVEAILAVSFLANEQVGTVRLEKYNS